MKSWRRCRSLRTGLIATALSITTWIGSAQAQPAEQGDSKESFYSWSALDLDGQDYDFAQFRGKVVLLNFWAAWCKPCLNEFPSIEKIHLKYAPRGLEVVGLSITERMSAIAVFLEKTGASFRILIDPQEMISNHYQVSDMPTTLILDRKGEVRLKVTGYSREGISEIHSMLETLLP